MFRLARVVFYALVILVAIGALGAGAFPNSLASAVHDAEAGWHWVVHAVHLVVHVAHTVRTVQHYRVPTSTHGLVPPS
jgi:hypothetical protein